jgi:NAD(P)-dependent dehydrogenase (short-subunit alcohol dehydrogenase family)
MPISSASEARIVIAGSEAARNDVPTFTAADLESVATKHFDGDRVAAAESLIRGTAPVKYKAANTYATAKLFVAWWAAELGRRLPEGMTVNAVSPGSAPDTGAARNATFFMRRVMMPMMKSMPKFMGLAATTEVAAHRYIEASTYGPDVTGQFFASAPKKLTGPLQRMDHPHVHDAINQAAAWKALEMVTAEMVSAG